MRSRLDSLLCWLLTALLLGAGARAQHRGNGIGEGCGSGNGTDLTSSCQQDSSCCCPDDAPTPTAADERHCNCKVPARDPAPAPAPSSPKLALPVCLPEPARAPPSLPSNRDAVPPRAEPRSVCAHGPLPHRTRQVAYSIWRL